MSALKPSSLPGHSKRIILTFSGVILVAIGFLFLWNRHQPMHKGKPVSYWVDRLYEDSNSNRFDFYDDVRQIGPPAVPYLVAKLKVKNTANREKWAKWREKLPAWLQNYFPNAADANFLHWEVPQMLFEMGPQAKAALPDLILLLDEKDPSYGTGIIDAIGAIGPDAKIAIPKLKERFSRYDHIHQVSIALAVWQIDRETNYVLQILEGALKLNADTTDERAASFCAESLLGEMGSAAQLSIPNLIEALSEKTNNAGLRSGAAMALGRLGYKEPEIISALLEASKDTNSVVQIRSSIALWRLDPTNKFVPQAAEVLLKHGVDIQRTGEEFLQFLHNNGMDVSEAAPVLKELSENKSPEISKLAADTLEEIDSWEGKTKTNGLR